MFENVDFFLTPFARSILLKVYTDFFRAFLPQLFKHFIFFLIVEFGSYTKTICYLLAARREKGRKNSVIWSGKNRIWSGKSHEILLLTEGGHSV